MNAFETGKAAALAGKAEQDNPFLTGEFTKMGNPKMTEEGEDWLNGFRSTVSRKATKAELEVAANLDVSRFRRKSNKYYR